MKKFVVKFENCYGIKKMEYPFDFSKLFEDIDSNANQVNVDITEATEYIDNTTDADFIKKLRNRVSLVSLVDENYLRFDHPNWDFYEKYSSTFKNFNMNVKKHPMLKVSAKGEKYYTDFDLAITFYGTVNLKNFKYLILEVNNKDNFIRKTFSIYNHSIFFTIIRKNYSHIITAFIRSNFNIIHITPPVYFLIQTCFPARMPEKFNKNLGPAKFHITLFIC